MTRVTSYLNKNMFRFYFLSRKMIGENTQMIICLLNIWVDNVEKLKGQRRKLKIKAFPPLKNSHQQNLV